MSEWNGKYYNEHAILQEAGAASVIEKFNLKGNESILDIGCGDGKITQKMAKLVPKGKVIGIDISQEMLREAFLNYKDENLQFLKMDAERLNFQEKFDIVTCFNTLHWIKDQEAVVKNVRAHLKPGGRLFFFMVSGMNKLVEEIFEKEPWKSHLEKEEKRYISSSMEQYQTYLSSNGFSIDRLKFEPFIYRFPTFNALVNSFMTWLPFQTGLEEKRCRSMAEDLAVNVSQKQDAKLGITLSTPMLWVEAHVPLL